jgi:uncharacterized protein (DUF433 family)
VAASRRHGARGRDARASAGEDASGPEACRRFPDSAESTLLRYLAMSYEDIITVEPGKRGGQPCIRGIRITVYDVLSYLASGMTEEEILSDFPDLTHDDIRACLAYGQ